MEWCAFNAIEAIGGPAADYRFGMIARSILASVGAKDLPDPPDFFPWNNFTVVLSAEELCRQSELGMM